MFLKLVKVMESDIPQFAGSPGPLGKKIARNSVKVVQATYGWHHQLFSQQQALKAQRGVKLSAMELVCCTVYCAFKRSCSHGPVLKPNQTKPGT